jgi:hypothetical protein
MEMSRTLTGVLAGCLVLVLATVAGAGIPDADESYVTLTNGGKGLTTCPAASSAYDYITVTALDSGLNPITGISSGDIYFTVTGTGSGNISIDAVDVSTDINGNIRFEVTNSDLILYGSMTIQVQIYTVVLSDSDLLWCNTYDYDDTGAVNLIDFVTFAGDFAVYNERSDFDWTPPVNLIDFVAFAAHFGHTE